MELRDRFQSHGKNSSSEKKGVRGKKEPTHQRHGDMRLVGLCLLVLTADVIAQVKMPCLPPVAV